MSDGMEKIGFLSDGLRDVLIFTAWIVGALLIGALTWLLTEIPRDRIVMKSVNSILLEKGLSLRVTMPTGKLLSWDARKGQMPLEKRFALVENRGEGAVFTFVSGGTFIPCLAVLDSNGKVMRFIALTPGDGDPLKDQPEALLRLYRERLEGR
jgi:hypothetical protein